MMDSLLPLLVKDDKIVNSKGDPIKLRGVCLGGWLNMENFINGYPGSEHGLRKTMAQTLGQDKSRFFFDRLLDYFITEADIRFIKSQGVNVVRIPFNYRHFESDSEPFSYLEAGFTRLDSILGWCAKSDIYAILDMHAAPGWQNPDWHSDNANRNTLLWEHPHFQTRLIRLWEMIAERYRDDPTVAGYDVINEPVIAAPRGIFCENYYHPEWIVINQLYHRLVEAIRAKDPDHIIFLEGDFFSSRFDGLDEPFASNLAYSGHIYTPGCFGPGTYPGKLHNEWWDKARQLKSFDEHEGTIYTRINKVPFWVGECGMVYDGIKQELPDRVRAFDDQLSIFNNAGTHWTTWEYKDVGIMGWVSLNPNCEYLNRIAQMLNTKRLLDTDFWLEWSALTPAKRMAADLARVITDSINDPNVRLSEIETYFRQSSLANFTGELLQVNYAKCFLGLSEVEIDRVLQSFKLENCSIHQDLIGVIRKNLPAAPKSV